MVQRWHRDSRGRREHVRRRGLERQSRAQDSRHPRRYDVTDMQSRGVHERVTRTRRLSIRHPQAIIASLRTGTTLTLSDIS